MLLNSVFIISREALEAALMISILLALTRLMGLTARSWVTGALVAGLIGSVLYAVFFDVLSSMFDGVGQEVINATMQYLVFAALLFCLYQGARYLSGTQRPGKLLTTLMAVAVGLAVTREGSEVLIYLTGFWRAGDIFVSVATGSAIGLLIGVSAGVLLYYLLIMQPERRARIAIQLTLALIGAGMCAQATQLLVQANWIDAAGPLWDSSALLAEGSPLGQLLYALIGYESTPTAIEVVIYVISLSLMALMYALGRRHQSRQTMVPA